jgi:D-alanyl-lipoteichoic acid acyltransferase DltB (MBOAT superfamily)
MGLMLTGYLKKVVLADGSAPLAEWLYGRAARGAPIHPREFIVGAAAFGWQIYGDFSGYRDIAAAACAARRGTC